MIDDPKHEDPTAEAALPGAPGASQLTVPRLPALTNPHPPPTYAPGPPGFPPVYGFAGYRPATGPWSFHEHHLFEQACIKHGWGKWKKIQEEVPGRTKEQCKSHGQKFQKQNPHMKEQLLLEHRRFKTAKHQHEGSAEEGKTPALSTNSNEGPAAKGDGDVSTQAKTPAEAKEPPKKRAQARKPSLKRAAKGKKADEAPTAFKKDRQPNGGKTQNFSVACIDTISNNIHERKQQKCCDSFPLCLCEKSASVEEAIAQSLQQLKEQPANAAECKGDEPAAK